MDHAGAALGTLLGVGLLWSLGGGARAPATGEQMRTVFLWAAVPGALALVALARHPRAAASPAAPRRPAARAGCRRRSGARCSPSPSSPSRTPPTPSSSSSRRGSARRRSRPRSSGSPCTSSRRPPPPREAGSPTGTGSANSLALGWTVYAVTWSAVGFVETDPAPLRPLRPLRDLARARRGGREGADRRVGPRRRQGEGLRHLQPDDRARRARREHRVRLRLGPLRQRRRLRRLRLLRAPRRGRAPRGRAEPGAAARPRAKS